MAKLVTGTYGEALYELAIEEKKGQEFLDEATAIVKIFADNADFGEMMNHPKITKEEKSEALKNVFSGKVSEEMLGFLLLVLQKDRYSEISGILQFFIDKMKEHMKIGTAFVTTAVSLKDSQKTDIEKKLLSTTSFKKIEINYTVEPELIGGMKIRIGDRVVDSSVKTKLEKLTKQLTDIQLV